MMVREKRKSGQGWQKLKRCKRVKMRDLNDVCRAEEMIENNRRTLSLDKEKSQEPAKDVTNLSPRIAQNEMTSKRLPSVVKPGIISFDLNARVCEPNNSVTMYHGDVLDNSKGFGWDVNAEDKSNSPKENPLCHFKNPEHLKSGDVSECGSTTGPLENKDPMRVWNEMKKNGFFSTSNVNVMLPRKRGKKRKSGNLKKKMELAQKEQADRFAKMAAPSGLLNDLNPGIINHVRNRKQVHAIIQALVKLENNYNHQGVEKQVVLPRGLGKDDQVSGLGMTRLGVSHQSLGKQFDFPRISGMDNHISGLGMAQLGASHCWSLSTSSMNRHTSGSLRFGTDIYGNDGNPKKEERWFFDKKYCPSNNLQEREDDALTLKLAPSLNKASENISSLSNEEFANSGILSSPSMEAAGVASQWLELLQQDIRSRLASLRRSKKRVQSVILTELPSLVSREFWGGQENDPQVVKNHVYGASFNENVDAHRAKWSAVFIHMEKSLCEEEKQLEIWLEQVVAMQLPCEKGLRQFHHHPAHGSQQLGTSEKDHGLDDVNESESELAVKAAAASIYSTCNFLSQSETLPCYQSCV